MLLLLLLLQLQLTMSSGQLGNGRVAELGGGQADKRRTADSGQRTMDTAGICTSILESNAFVRLRVLPGPVLAPPQLIWGPPRNWGEHT